jgi:hypothetical protein
MLGYTLLRLCKLPSLSHQQTRERSKSPFPRRWSWVVCGREGRHDPCRARFAVLTGKVREDRRRSEAKQLLKSPVKNQAVNLDPSSAESSPLQVSTQESNSGQSLDPSSSYKSSSQSKIPPPCTDQAQQDAMEQSFITDHRPWFPRVRYLHLEVAPLACPLAPEMQLMVQTNPQMQAQTQVQMGTRSSRPQMQGYQQPGMLGSASHATSVHPAHPLSRPVMQRRVDGTPELQHGGMSLGPSAWCRLGSPCTVVPLGWPPLPPAPVMRLYEAASMHNRNDKATLWRIDRFESQETMLEGTRNLRVISLLETGKSNRSKSPERRSRSQDFSKPPRSSQPAWTIHGKN